jgi:hypothetical protein
MVWIPHPQPDPARPAPFAPDHSAVLTMASVPAATTRQLAVVLATTAGGAFILAGLAVAFGGGWAVPVAVVAAVVGLVLKAIFFNPWLTLGVALDALVLGAALVEWPVSLI